MRRAMVKTMTEADSIPTFGYDDELDMSALVELRLKVKAITEERVGLEGTEDGLVYCGASDEETLAMN
jgi:pyruvate/2-oxoglutarate dehydrogenase complex dihydrolipoamide acyltransferase (E2) component